MQESNLLFNLADAIKLHQPVNLHAVLPITFLFNVRSYQVYSIPQGVRQAVLAIWATLAVSALSALIAKLAGLSSQGEFVGFIVSYAIFCIVPYKLANRSNATRYVYVVLTAISFLFLAAGVGALNKIDFATSVLVIPAEIFIIFKLFQPEASAWYVSK